MESNENSIVTKNVLRSRNLRGYSFTTDYVYKARDEGKLLTLRLDTNNNCNIACKYCYSAPQRTAAAQQMSREMLKSVIDQAYELGLESVVYLGGGEPLMYRDFWWFMEYLHSINVIPVVFTNGTLITRRAAEDMYQLGVSVIIKFDGFEKTQDFLTQPGTYQKIQLALNDLLESGYGAPNETGDTRIGAAPCACVYNVDEIPEIWRLLRKKGVYPNVERATNIGNAKVSNMMLSNEQTAQLYKTLSEIDKNEFGINWESPYSGYPAHSCFISLVGCHIKADGGIALCSEFDSFANVTEKPLAEVLKGDLFQKVRYSEKYLCDPCSSCDYLRTCLGGCRSKCFTGTGDIFGYDPSCVLCKAQAM